MTVQTIITAAGDSRRMFVEGGFGSPKSLVVVDGKTVLQHAVEAYTLDFSALRIAVNEDEASEWGVDRHVRELFPDSKVFRVNSGAQGALVSALLATSNLDLNEPLVIAAGDSRVNVPVSTYAERFRESAFPASTLVFSSSGKRWSYVALDSDGSVLEVSEKYEVSSLATTGFFFFQTAQSFIDSAKWVLMNNATVNGRYYVSTALNFLISRGAGVGYELLPADQYKSWSLPVDFVMGGWCIGYQGSSGEGF